MKNKKRPLSDTSSIDKTSKSNGSDLIPCPVHFHYDWPNLEGDIDLTTHDNPHESSHTEWWYFNTHLTFTDHHPLAFFVSFFRTQTAIIDGKVQWSHALNFSLIDSITKKCYPYSFIDHKAPAIISAKLHDEDENQYDTCIKKFIANNLSLILSRAILEVTQRGNIPLPDQLLSEQITVEKDRLFLDYDGQILYKNNNGHYVMNLRSKPFTHQHGLHMDQIPLPTPFTSISLTFIPQISPVRNGHEGLTRVGRHGDTMFYYFIPGCKVESILTFDGQEYMGEGYGWYDHEFGGFSLVSPYSSLSIPKNNSEIKSSDQTIECTCPFSNDSSDRPSRVGWTWFSIVSNDYYITISEVNNTVNIQHPVKLDQYIIIYHKNKRQFYDDIVVTPLKYWTSSRTFVSFPVQWALSSASCNLYLEVETTFDDQEFMTILSSPSFYEASIRVKGHLGSVNLEGNGFVERHGFASSGDVTTFLKNGKHYYFFFMSLVSKKTLEKIDLVIPRKPTYQQIQNLIGEPSLPQYMNGVDIDLYIQTIINPLRDIVDRGGKAWRSYACLACVDCVGGDSREVDDWLALPELMHCGSLIIDDIQDKSNTRRGGPTIHNLYGESIAINAGTAGYFLGQVLHNRPFWKKLTVSMQVKFYEIYFQSVRAAHAGQALDIYGLHHLMENAIETGDNNKLLKSCMAIHRLKSAAPAAGIARMGVILGGGTETQILLFGRFFESLGVAFQIMGMYTVSKNKKIALKERGEDIKEGKVTYPICLALSLLDLNKRRRIWTILQQKTDDQSLIDEAVNILEEVQALDLCVKQAKDMVNDSWEPLSLVIPDSFSKCMLRAFAFFVLERLY